jgi:hypothetical protein
MIKRDLKILQPIEKGGSLVGGSLVGGWSFFERPRHESRCSIYSTTLYSSFVECYFMMIREYF